MWFEDYFQATYYDYSREGTMNFSAVLTVRGDAQKLLAVFAAEDMSFPNQRASYEVAAVDGDSLQVIVSAVDAVAMRAVLNSVCKVLIVFEKAMGVVEDGS